MIPWKHMHSAAGLCAAAGLILAVVTPAVAQRGEQYRDVSPPRANPQFLSAFREATAEASRSTVRVLCDEKEAALGTIVRPDGWVLTKYSLLSGNISCKLKNGKTLAARLVGVHESFDLAMLKVEATNLAPATLTPSSVAPVGSWLVSVGPGEDPVAVGVMSVAMRNPPPVVNRPERPNFTPRGTASPVFGATLVGLMASLPAQAPWLAAGALVPRRTFSTDYLGVNVTPDGKSAKIVRVGFQSAAARAGLKVDDKIVSIQGSAVTDQSSLLAVLAKMKPGDLATIKLVRDGKEMELQAKLEARGPRGRPDQNLMGSELSEKRTGFPTYFQSDTVIKPKDCGGPVCDLDGRVLGINIARAGRVESYSIPTEVLTPLLADLMSGKLSPRVAAAAALEKKIVELRTALQKAEEDKAAARKRFEEAREALNKHEADRADAERKWKDAKDALDKAEKELKSKK
jgi:serine protease Do